MKIKELRELSDDELVVKEKAFKKELYELNYQRKMGGVEKPSRFRLLKRSVARVLTILNERKQEESKKEK